MLSSIHHSWSNAELITRLGRRPLNIAITQTLSATGAQKVFVTHGFQSVFSRWLNENGIKSAEVKTEYGGEEEEQDKPSTTDQQEEEINKAGS